MLVSCVGAWDLRRWQSLQESYSSACEELKTAVGSNIQNCIFE